MLKYFNFNTAKSKMYNSNKFKHYFNPKCENNFIQILTRKFKNFIKISLDMYRFILSTCIGIAIGYGVAKISKVKPILDTEKSEDEDLNNVVISNSFTTLDSVSTESSVDVQKEILTTLAQIRALNEFQERKGEKYFESSGRILNCPSKLMQRAKYRDNFANRKEALKHWTLKFSKNYKNDGVFIVPAVNFSCLLDELLAESSYIIIKSFCRDSCTKAGLVFEEVFEHEDPEDERCIWCEFRDNLSPSINKIMFVTQFYKEFICFQIFQNTNIAETEQFIMKLYNEMTSRYSEEFLDFPFVEVCTDNIKPDHRLSKPINYARLAAQQWAEILFRLGTHVKLPFKPINTVKTDTEHVYSTSDVDLFEESSVANEIFKF